VLHIYQGSLEEQVKLALEAIGLQERRALEQFYAAVRKATPHGRVLGERYGGDVSFSFDSNGRSVWVMALFGKGAPPVVRTVSDREVPWIPLDEEQEENGIPLPLPPSILRDGPPGLLRMNGICPCGPPEGERIRERICEMLHLVLWFISIATCSRGEPNTARPFETALRASSGRADS